MSQHTQSDTEAGSTDRRAPEKTSDPIPVAFDGPDDLCNPLNFSRPRKWLITIIVINGSFCVAVTSSIYTSTYSGIVPSLTPSHEVATLGLSLFVLGLGISPLFLSPLSEYYGRRPIYLVSFFLFFVFQIPAAFAQNIATLLIVRFLAGFSGSAFLSVAGGSISDVFSGQELTFPLACYSSSPFFGPVAGPLIGGYINQYSGTWRWTFRVTMIWTFLVWIALIVLVPETFAPALHVTKAKALRKRTGDETYMASIEMTETSLPRTILKTMKRPFILFAEPMIFLLNTWTSILLAILYLFFSAFPLVFENNHDFTLSQVGLTFLGIGIGTLVAVASIPSLSRLQRHIGAKRKQKGEDETYPEIALVPAMFGAVLGPIGLFWFAFTTSRSVHPIVPILSGIPFGCAVVLTFTSVFTFLVVNFRPWAASAMATNSIYRSTLAAIFPLFAVQMYERLGYRWASALLAFLVLSMLPVPFIFYMYGAKIRARSRIRKLVWEGVEE